MAINILTVVPSNKSKEKMKRYEELGSKIKDLVSSITKNSDDYGKIYMKIKFNSDDDLPLNKMIEPSFMKMTNIIHKFFSGECLYKLRIVLKCYILVGITILKEMTLIKQMHQKSVIYVTTVIS